MRPDLLATAFFVVVSGVFAAPIFADMGNWGILDWDMHLFHQAVPRITLVDYGQFPLWNPYNWSGVPMLANPESRFLAPTFPLTLALGEVVATKLEILFFLVIGMLGGWKLARSYGISGVGALGCGLLLMLNSWYALHLTVGHLWALNIALLPWAVLFYRRAVSDLRYSLATSGVLLWMFFSGGVYPLMMTLLMLAAHSAIVLLRSRADWGVHARLFGFVSIQTLCLSAIKLLPTAESLSRYPRLTAAEAGYSFASLGSALFSRTQTLAETWAARPQDFNGTLLHEGMYIGLPALAVIAMGVWHSFRKHPEWVVLLALFTWISLGSNAAIPLWTAIHSLPGFDNMRVPQRFGLVMLLSFSLLFGAGLDGVRDRVARAMPSRASTAVAGALGVLVVADLFLVNAPIFRSAFPIPPVAVERGESFVQARAHPIYGPAGRLPATPARARTSQPFAFSGSGLYPALLSNRGSLFGYPVVPSPSRAVPFDAPKYRGEVYVAEANGSAEITAWSPNRMRVSVSAQQPGLLVVNQTADPGWRTEDGRQSGAFESLLAVEISPQDREIELFYRPTSFVVGAAITVLGALLLAFVPWTRGSGRT